MARQIVEILLLIFFFLRFKSTDQAGTKISNHELSLPREQFYALCSKFLRILCRKEGERQHRTGKLLLPSLKVEFKKSRVRLRF